MRSLETFDELHSTAAAGARRRLDWRGRLVVGVLPVWAFEADLWRVEQSAAQSQFVGAMTVGEKPVMANAIEAVGQDVKQETADELASRELHRLMSGWSILAIVRRCPEGMLKMGERRCSP